MTKPSDAIISPLESALASFDPDAMGRKLAEIDTDGFAEINDLWKPTTPGEQLLGVLVGSEKSRFVSDTGVVASWWAFAALNRKTLKAEPRRILGTVALERALAGIAPGTVVQITYEGTEKVEKGTVHKYTVKAESK